MQNQSIKKSKGQNICKMKVFILEEHHESFIVWFYAMLKKMIPASQNTLIHIDQHADLELPILKQPYPEHFASVKDVYDFTHRNLGIDDFIVAAIFGKIFNHVIWINHDPFKKVSDDFVIFSINSKGRFFALKKATEHTLNKPDARSFHYQAITLSRQDIKIQQCLLNIDLDFFSCIKKPLPFAKIETTKNEWDNIKNNPYHIIRTNTNNKIDYLVENNKYYILINHLPEKPKYGLEVNSDMIRKRIEKFGQFLEINNIIPALITVCRSRFSGYTPDNQWELIENMLMDKLKKIYGEEKNLDIIKISDLDLTEENGG